MTKPSILGLTGSIGMGKSTVSDMFADSGVPVFDADAEVRAMQGSGGILVEEIEEAFPGSTGPQGVLRDALGAQVFGNPDALARLEEIVHPKVAARRAEFLEKHSKADWVLFDIPLLFEKGGAETVDYILVVSAPPSVQRARVLDRPGMTPEKFDDILSLQLPDDEKRALSDYVIDTGTTLEETQAQVTQLLEKLRSGEA